MQSKNLSLSETTGISKLISGPHDSKLTKSLVNEISKFQTLIPQICQYFLLKQCEKLTAKASLILFVKKFLCIWLLSCKRPNKLIKLTML